MTNFDILETEAARAHWRLLEMIRDYLRRPTERNACYAVGWIAAAQGYSALNSAQATYWRALVSVYEGADASRTREPLAIVRKALGEAA